METPLIPDLLKNSVEKHFGDKNAGL